MPHRFRRILITSFSLFILMHCVKQAEASQVTLDFNGLSDFERIGDYYNGGFGSLGSGPGPNFGVTFNQNATELLGFSNPEIVLLPGTPIIMNVMGGFDGSFSLQHADPSEGKGMGVVRLFSGLDGTGSLLGTLILPGTLNANSYNASLNPVNTLTFSGTARSAVLSGTPNFITFDNITFNTGQVSNPVPEPTTMLLLGTGLASIGGVVRRRHQGKEK